MVFSVVYVASLLLAGGTFLAMVAIALIASVIWLWHRATFQRAQSQAFHAGFASALALAQHRQARVQPAPAAWPPSPPVAPAERRGPPPAAPVPPFPPLQAAWPGASLPGALTPDEHARARRLLQQVDFETQ